VSVSLAQGRLKDQVETLLERMQNRGLVDTDPGFRDVSAILPLPADFHPDALRQMTQKTEIETRLREHADALYQQREQELGADNMRMLERLVMLQIMDRLWVEHLTEMDRERLQAGWAGLRQIKSADAYKRSGFERFDILKDTIRHDVAMTIYHVNLVTREPAKETQSPMAKAAVGSRGNARPKAPAAGQKVGRNDPCPCGSGKKYKHCCGK